MKKIQIIILFIILTQQVFAINFFTGSYNEAINKAKLENKSILLDFGAKWCGPCHEMEKNVLSDREISKYTDKNFFTLKIDVDTKSGDNLKRRFEVHSVPHYIILNTSEKVLAEVRGKLAVKEFINFLKLEPAAKHSVDRKFSEDDAIAKYEQSKKDFKNLLDLIRIMNQKGLYDTSLTYLNNYPLNLRNKLERSVYYDCLLKNYELAGSLNDTLKFDSLQNFAIKQKFVFSEIKLLEYKYYKESGNYDVASASLNQFLLYGYTEMRSKLYFFSIALNYLIEFGYASDRKEFVIDRIDQLFEEHPKDLSKYENKAWCQRSILYHKCIFLDALGQKSKAKKVAESIIGQYPIQGFTKIFFASEFKEELERIIQN